MWPRYSTCSIGKRSSAFSNWATWYFFSSCPCFGEWISAISLITIIRVNLCFQTVSITIFLGVGWFIMHWKTMNIHYRLSHRPVECCNVLKNSSISWLVLAHFSLCNDCETFICYSKDLKLFECFCIHRVSHLHWSLRPIFSPLQFHILECKCSLFLHIFGHVTIEVLYSY